MIKSFLVIAVLVGAGTFLLGRIPSWKQQIVEVINPAEREAKVLGTLKTNLNALESTLNETARAKTPKEISTGLEKTRNILTDSQTLVDQITSINQGTAKALASQLGQLANIFSDTPEPGTPITTPPAASCLP